MKRILFLLIVINTIMVTLGFGMFYLSETFPFQPGDSFYGVQNAAETWRLRLSPRGEAQTKMAINLAERRLVYLAQVEGHDAKRESRGRVCFPGRRAGLRVRQDGERQASKPNDANHNTHAQ